jgi:hypothetical protein
MLVRVSKIRGIEHMPWMIRAIASILVLSSGWAAQPEACDATAMWELMIEAKGGRERLHNVSTMLKQSRDLRSVVFYRLPDFIWGWTDERPTVFGVTVGWINTSIGINKFQSGPCDEWDCGVRTREFKKKLPSFRLQMLYLMETQFLEPTIVGCGEERIDGKKRRYVEVTKGPIAIKYKKSNGKNVRQPEGTMGLFHVKYYLPRKGFLPDIVTYQYSIVEVKHYFSNYQSFGGIQLPTVVKIDDGVGKSRFHFHWEVNPLYDPKIVTGEPSLEKGPDAWRPLELRGKTKPEGPPTEVEYQIFRKTLPKK